MGRTLSIYMAIVVHTALPLTIFCVGKSGFCWPQAHSPKPHFNVLFFFASWTAWLYNIALWRWPAAKSHFRRWSQECLIPLVKLTEVRYQKKKKKNQPGPTPDRCFVFLSFFNRKKWNKAGRLPIYCYVTWPFTFFLLLFVRIWWRINHK